MSGAHKAVLALAAGASLLLAIGSGCSKILGFHDGNLSDGGAGQPCDNDNNNGTPCQAGLICIGGQSSDHPGVCAASCASDDQCATGQRCLAQCGSLGGSGGGAPYGCGASSQPCSSPGNNCSGGGCECPCGQVCADDYQCRNSCNSGGSPGCPGGEVCVSEKRGGGFACYGTSSAHDPDVQEGAVAPTACTGDGDCPSGERCLQQSTTGCPQGNCNGSLLCVSENQPCSNPCNGGNCACPAGATCGNDGQCRNSCQFGATPSGCPGGEVCLPSGSGGCSSCPGSCYGTSSAHDPDVPDAGDQGERWLVVASSGTYYLTDPGCGNPRQLDARLGFDYVTALSPGGDVALGVLVSPPQGGGPISVFVPGDGGAQQAHATGNFPFWSADGGAFYSLAPSPPTGCQVSTIGLEEQTLGADAGTTVGTFTLTASGCGPTGTAFLPGLVVSESHGLAATLSQTQGGSNGEQVVFASIDDAGTPAAPGVALGFIFGSSDTGFVAYTNGTGGQNQLIHIGWDGSVSSLYQSAGFIGGSGAGAYPPCAPHRIGASGNFYCNNSGNGAATGVIIELNLDARAQQILTCLVDGQPASIVDVVEP